MEVTPFSYEAEGRTFTGCLADGSAGRPAPGILVIHESGGLVGHTRRRAAMLAELGYVAFAMDLYGEPISGIDRGRAINRELIADAARLLRGRCGAALAALGAHPHVDPARLAAVGYCFGGAAAIELARTGAPLAAVAGFHAGILPGTAADNAAIRGKILLCHGADDPAVPPDQIRAFAAALDEAGIDWQLHLYGGVGHSFTNREIDAWKLPGFFYHEAADRRSWAAMRLLLDEAFA